MKPKTKTKLPNRVIAGKVKLPKPQPKLAGVTATFETGKDGCKVVVRDQRGNYITETYMTGELFSIFAPTAREWLRMPWDELIQLVRSRLINTP